MTRQSVDVRELDPVDPDRLHVDQEDSVDPEGESVFEQLSAGGRMGRIGGGLAGLDFGDVPGAAPLDQVIGPQVDPVGRLVDPQVELAIDLGVDDRKALGLEQLAGPLLSVGGPLEATLAAAASRRPAGGSTRRGSGPPAGRPATTGRIG